MDKAPDEQSDNLKNQRILSEYQAVRESKIKNEEKMFGVLALVLSFMTFGAGIQSGAVALFFANLGYKRGQKFEYAVGQKSKQKTLASLAMIITIFGIIFYYITSFGDITKTLDGLPYWFVLE